MTRLTQILSGFAIAPLMLISAMAEPSPGQAAQSYIETIKRHMLMGMWENGCVSTISIEPHASDDLLIKACVEQLNQRPGPLKTWQIIAKEHIATHDFMGNRYLVAVVSSDQGDKIMTINEAPYPEGVYWARMYNCDSVFSSPQDGGTPLIR